MKTTTSSGAPYTPLLPDQYSGHRRSFGIVASILSLLALLPLPISTSQITQNAHDVVLPRGVAEGVSAKSYPESFAGDSFNWTSAMFSWQRTTYHFQPQLKWMNDPCGPLYYKGWYHIFYQYNPDSATWGNITWGHAVSKNLIQWLHLPLAKVPDQWHDIKGVWTGSATILPNGEIIMLYTGHTYATVQVQNLAVPANLSDPLLIDWVKYSGNPVLTPPSGIGSKDFRDPTTAWTGPNGTWLIAIGSKNGTTGIALVYQTSDFKNYTLLEKNMHGVPNTGMWECVDFYPLAMNGSTGLDTSADGPGIKHVLKASLDTTRADVFAIGSYDVGSVTWTPDNPEEDVGIGLLYDYGKHFYASKTFFDPIKKRRILWGWINETDTEEDDVEKGWSGIMNVPRTILFDNKTGSNIIQWPVEEVETLRLNKTVFKAVAVGPGKVVPLHIGSATQLDILAEFEIEDLESRSSNDTSGCGDGAADRSTYGPFGLLILADKSLSELTPIYFRPSISSNVTYFCADQSRSSLAPEVYNHVYGGKVTVLDGESFTMRVLVDHSALESFAQGGRTVLTSRVYPTEAIYRAARLFLFNNATGVNVKATVKVWLMNSASIHSFPLD